MDRIDVLCVGNATIDVFVLLNQSQKVTYDKFSNQIAFTLGEKIPLGKHINSLGGNACNVSVGLSRMGLKTSLAAEVGNDEFSQKIINTLTKEEVDISLLRKDIVETPYFNIVLSLEGERVIFEEEVDVERELQIGQIQAKFIYLTSSKGNWKKVYEDIFSKNKDSRFAFNPGAKQLESDLEYIKNLLPKIEILFVNVGEAQKILGSAEIDIKNLLKSIKGLGVKIVVITDGINGSYAVDETRETFQIGVISKDKPKERTGAGDSYATGFIYAILNGYSVEEAMRYGALNADSVIKKVGAQEGLLNKGEIEQKSKENLGLMAVKI